MPTNLVNTAVCGFVFGSMVVDEVAATQSHRDSRTRSVTPAQRAKKRRQTLQRIHIFAIEHFCSLQRCDASQNIDRV